MEYGISWGLESQGSPLCAVAGIPGRHSSSQPGPGENAVPPEGSGSVAVLLVSGSAECSIGTASIELLLSWQ